MGSVGFFETQFQRQVKAGEFELNPFERLALDYVHGRVLDLGCGLGNLAIEAARRGCTVTAVDASPTAIERIRSAAARDRLAIEAIEADVLGLPIDRDYDTIVAIGLLMFFRAAQAYALLEKIKAGVRPGGCAIVNVLTEGTTFMGMFTPGEYHLFRTGELIELFAGWTPEVARQDSFPAPGNTTKVFDTVIARKATEL
jgi:tellurite methyltransferase